ncbi:hypothetical protein [Candidatus Babela massiliensis]|uniref:Uncharacterized protein n=1 Tax=Candidatus Babela massiliensis TaxID=673862 RepID=V6DGD8_9BACT|nr:hypothetical protein [Candidatus Babela massiliensis]CDK30667.1 hypothetical protein BABL1_gene_348 [Candidatus Babela massiliensis]
MKSIIKCLLSLVISYFKPLLSEIIYQPKSLLEQTAIFITNNSDKIEKSLQINKDLEEYLEKYKKIYSRKLPKQLQEKFIDLIPKYNLNIIKIALEVIDKIDNILNKEESNFLKERIISIPQEFFTWQPSLAIISTLVNELKLNNIFSIELEILKKIYNNYNDIKDLTILSFISVINKNMSEFNKFSQLPIKYNCPEIHLILANMKIENLDLHNAMVHLEKTLNSQYLMSYMLLGKALIKCYELCLTEEIPKNIIEVTPKYFKELINSNHKVIKSRGFFYLGLYNLLKDNKIKAYKYLNNSLKGGCYLAYTKLYHIYQNELYLAQYEYNCDLMKNIVKKFQTYYNCQNSK